MPLDERRALQALLAQMRTIHEELARHRAGVCVLHVEAAIASLESRLKYSAMEGEMPHQPCTELTPFAMAQDFG